MALLDKSGDDEISIFYRIFIETTGFFLGVIVGGITGYFGNWLWHKFGPKKDKPHFQLEGEDNRISFSGVMNKSNCQQVLSSLKSAIQFSEDEDDEVVKYEMNKSESSSKST